MRNKKIEITASKRMRFVLALSAITIMASGCGQQAYREDGEDDGQSLVGGGGSILPGNGGVVDPVSGVATVGDPLANANSDYSWHFKVTGSGYGTPIGSSGPMHVIVDNKIKIRITAGDGLPLSGSGWSIGFNCEKFTVKVGNVTKTAFVKKTSYQSVPNDPCASAGTSWTGDFSGAFDTGGGEANVVISNAYYDNCRLQGGYGPYYGGCGPMTAVYSTHSVDANMEVFVDQ